jgi:uncharacterized protein (TIGR03663 family)
MSVKRQWLVAGLWIIALAAAAAIRLPRLDLRPMHADEAVQAARFRELWLDGTYRYDPDEFHGPTLMYATLPSVMVGGAATPAETSEATYRVVPVVFGVGMLLLFWLLRDALGRAGSAWSAILAACSPAFVFYSRYYIHETLLACFTLAALASSWRYLRSGRLAWCALAGVAIGLMQATKETAPIAYVAAALALVAVAAARRWTSAAQTLHWRWSHLALVAAIALLTAVTLLSSLFTNLRGPLDGVLTYLPWLGRAGGQSSHIHAWHFYLSRLLWWRAGDGPRWSEAMILGLALVGAAAGFLPQRVRKADVHGGFVRWLTCYTLLVTVIYSAIPYKTPWCLLQFLVGMVMLAGVGIEVVLGAARRLPVRVVITVLLAVAAGHLLWQAYRASYVFAADPRNPYVYAQTSGGAVRLYDQLLQLADVSPEGFDTPVKVVWSDTYYWPLPWYLRQFSQTQWWTHLPDDAAAPIVISSPQYDEALTKQLDATHIMVGYFELRPRVLMQLWVRLDFWESHLRRLGRL